MNLKLVSNLSLKFLSVIIAIVLWFAVLGSRNVEITKEVPIEIITPQDLVISNEVPDKVAFRLSGPKAFLRNILNRKEDPIRINFSSARPGVLTYRFFHDNIQVPLGVKVLSINPASVVIKLEMIKRKEVPVRLSVRGEMGSGIKLSKLALNKNTIRIKGPESRIDQVPEVSSLPVDLSEIQDSGDREAGIDLSRYPGISVDGEMPRYHFEVSQTASNFKLKNIEVKVLTSRPFTVVPKEVSVYVRCSPEELKNIEKSKLFAFADAKDKSPGQYELPLSVQLPAAIKAIKVLPSKVKINIR